MIVDKDERSTETHDQTGEFKGKFYSRLQDAVMRVYDEMRNVMETRLGRLGFSFLRKQNLATLRRKIRALVTAIDSLFSGNFVPPFP
jgi:hypothetical protein